MSPFTFRSIRVDLHTRAIFGARSVAWTYDGSPLNVDGLYLLVNWDQNPIFEISLDVESSYVA